MQAVPFAELLQGLAEGPDIIPAASSILRKNVDSLARMLTAGAVTAEMSAAASIPIAVGAAGQHHAGKRFMYIYFYKNNNFNISVFYICIYFEYNSCGIFSGAESTQQSVHPADCSQLSALPKVLQCCLQQRQLSPVVSWTY
jgi:hypothetical protein